jgi:hypothetical protein
MTNILLNSERSNVQDLKGEVNPFWELLKWIFGLSQHTLPAIALGKILIANTELQRRAQRALKRYRF